MPSLTHDHGPRAARSSDPGASIADVVSSLRTARWPMVAARSILLATNLTTHRAGSGARGSRSSLYWRTALFQF